ncbi:hypothetical protein WG8_3374 [Paenibacillus sp. Aloe-11]|nr:hypothetical protein WG8_3374 [Paenibacillus sp. Aloe-11]
MLEKEAQRLPSTVRIGVYVLEAAVLSRTLDKLDWQQ